MGNSKCSLSFKTNYLFCCNAPNVSKPIVVLFQFLTFNKLYIYMFCIKDMPTACSPMGGLNAHTRKKNQDLKNWKKLGKSQSFIELQPSAQSLSRNENFVKTSKKNPEKQKLNFSRSALYHMKTRVGLKYFVHDCLQKQCFASNLPQLSSNMIYLTILVILRPLTQF